MPSPRSPRNARLSIIAEDGDAVQTPSGAPRVLPRSTHRPFSRQWKDLPPRHSAENPPPLYTIWDTAGPSREKLNGLRIKKSFVTRRGGWKRLLLTALIVLIIIATLAVGLGVGLTRSQKRGNGNPPSLPSSDPSSPIIHPQPFPGGSYIISTYLNAISTACTANPLTFRCYPYATYSSGSNTSMATFEWVISRSNGGFAISSSDNPFSFIFENVSLTLADANTDSQRYTFNYTMDKIVIPSASITPDGSQSECFFNGTELTVALYTRRRAMQTSTGKRTSISDGAVWENWPYAAEVNQTVSAGQNVPNCYKGINGASGPRITSGLAPQPTSSQCGCFYKNYNL